MRRRLPPLNVLRGFEAAARHLSFTRAADELSVTQGAISRQVKELEAHLGERLFIRMTRRIELTQEGEHFFRNVEAMLDELERAVTRIARRKLKRTLTISALPTIATTWLMPRLHLLTARHPEIDVRVVSSIEPAELLEHDADVAIRVGRLPGRHYGRHQPRIEIAMVKSWAGVQADELFPDRLVPVCSSDLIIKTLSDVGDLLRFPLIHTTTRRHAWPDWLRAQGVRQKIEVEKGLQFGHFFMSLDAARQGRGIAIVPDALLASDLSRAGLRIAFDSDLASAGEYYLLVHETRLDDPNVRLFRSWALTQARGIS